MQDGNILLALGDTDYLVVTAEPAQAVAVEYRVTVDDDDASRRSVGVPDHDALNFPAPAAGQGTLTWWRNLQSAVLDLANWFVRHLDDAGDPIDIVGRRAIETWRLRLVDPKRINPFTIMPAYHKTSGLQRVARDFVGQPLLTAQEIEDVIAFLVTLQ